MKLANRLSLNENGEYDAELGLAMLRKYAEKYGFGEKSGVEVAEICHRFQQNTRRHLQLDRVQTT